MYCFYNKLTAQSTENAIKSNTTYEHNIKEH